jgi:hypothetical protein
MNYDPDYERWLDELEEEMKAKEAEYYDLEERYGYLTPCAKREIRRHYASQDRSD